MTSPLLDRAGAVLGEPPDDAVAAHYGDPLREQRLATETCVVVDRSNRGVVRVAGQDRLPWLHSLTSQHLDALPIGVAAEALVLSPHGHVEHHLVVVDDGAATWLHVEPGTSAALLTFLDSMRFLLRVEPADVSADYAVLTLLGPDCPDVLARATLPAEVRAHPRRWPAAGVDLLVPRALLADVSGALAVPPAGLGAYDALRVAAREPRLGFETDHRTIPHEVGWLETAVHLDKGCYRGQETVARVHNLGRPPRRLVLLHLDGTEVVLPAQGAPVTWDGVPVGFVGTAVRHYELGPLALALVKRTTPDDAAPLLAGDVPARIDP